MRMGGSALLLVVALALATSSAPLNRSQAARLDALNAPWNFITIIESGTVQSVLADVADIEAVFRWDPVRAAFDVWRAELPAALNSLQELNAGDPIWLLVSASSEWNPGLFVGSRTVNLVAGWNTVGWTGPEASASQVASTLQTRRLVAFSSVTQTFTSFDTTLPPALNTLESITHAQALWVLMDIPTSALIPSAQPPSEEPSAPEPAPPSQPNCHPSYPTVCIPPPPPDLNCGDIPHRGFQVIGSDPHRFDADGDGVGCES